MARIFWDLPLLDSLLEDDAEHAGRIAALRERMVDRGDCLVVSAITLGHVLARVRKAGGDEASAAAGRALLSGAEIVPFDDRAALIYAAILADPRIDRADAEQLASASRAGIDLFIAHDDRFARTTVPNVSFISSLERAPL